MLNYAHLYNIASLLYMHSPLCITFVNSLNKFLLIIDCFICTGTVVFLETYVSTICWHNASSLPCFFVWERSLINMFALCNVSAGDSLVPYIPCITLIFSDHESWSAYRHYFFAPWSPQKMEPLGSIGPDPRYYFRALWRYEFSIFF